MISKFFSDKATYLKLASIFLLLKIITYSFDIIPVGQELNLRYQLLHPMLLENDLLKSLYFSHYQPPIWNLIYGIMIKIFGINYEIISIWLHIFNIFLSFVMVYYFFLICKFFKLESKKIYINYLIFFIFSISFLYYETYLHYTHLTVFLFAQLTYLYLKFSRDQNLINEILIYSTALILVYTWTAFGHPLFIFVIFSGIFLIKFKKNFFRSFIIFIFFAFLAILPSIKNKIELNFFTNSTLIGLQLVLVLSFDDNWDYYSRCDFDKSKSKIYERSFLENNPNLNITHPSLIGELSEFNNVGFVEKSKECLKIGISQIYKDPLRYFGRVKFLFISSHGHFTFDHIGWDPKEWRKYFGLFYDINENKFISPIKVRLLQLYYLLVYLFFISLTIKNILLIHKDDRIFQKTLSSIFFIYIWLMAVIYLATGMEHERMRHTGHFIHVLFFIILIKNNFKIKLILKDIF